MVEEGPSLVGSLEASRADALLWCMIASRQGMLMLCSRANRPRVASGCKREGQARGWHMSRTDVLPVPCGLSEWKSWAVYYLSLAPD